MKILSIISHKGGAGKTSTAVMLAEELARRGMRVLLVDADRQRSAGLLLGLESPTGSVQPTQQENLRYFCSCDFPVEQLAAKVAEVQESFDLAVTDTPSLDDPVARGWVKVSTAALALVPVEPITLKTLDGVTAQLDSVRELNPGIQMLGCLPTMYDASSPTQRSLMHDLVAHRLQSLFSTSIPYDPGMAHRAEQRAERRTEAAETTLKAYRAVADSISRSMKLADRRPAPAPAPATARTSMPLGALAAAASPAGGAAAGSGRASAPAGAAGSRSMRSSSPAAPAQSGMPRWLVPALAALLILIVAVACFMAFGANLIRPGGR